MQKVYRYIKIYKAVLKRSISRSYVYRIEVLSRIFRAFLLISLQLIILNSIFGSSSDFIGYSKTQTLLIIGLFDILNYSAWAIFLVNLGRLEERVEKGELDSLLLLPLNSIFSVSLTDFFIYDFASILAGLILVIYYFITNGYLISFGNVIYGLVAFILSFILLFFINLLFSSFSFSKTKTGILLFIKEIYSLARFPMDIWGPSLQLVFLTFMPIAFLTTIPSKIIFGMLQPIWLMYGLIATVIFSVISILIWKWNVKKYVSFGG